MASQSPAAPVEEDTQMDDVIDEATTEVKVEDSAVNEDNATNTITASPAKESTVWPTKADKEIMEGIVKRLTEYTMPGYVDTDSFDLLAFSNSSKFRQRASSPISAHGLQKRRARILRHY